MYYTKRNIGSICNEFVLKKISLTQSFQIGANDQSINLIGPYSFSTIWLAVFGHIPPPPTLITLKIYKGNIHYAQK